MKNKKIIYGDRSQTDIPVQNYLTFDLPPWVGDRYYTNIFTKRFRPFLKFKFLGGKLKSLLHDITVIYAFARTLDNLVDETDCIFIKYNAIHQAKKILNFVYDEKGDIKQCKMAYDLKKVVQKYKIEQKDMLNLVTGITQDINGFKTPPTFRELNAYIEKVSITPAIILDSLFQGKKDPQVTNALIKLYKSAHYYSIITNIEEDAKQGRIYIPKELLEINGLNNITPQNIMQHDISRALKTFVFIADRYNQSYMKELRSQKNYPMQFTYWFISQLNDEYKKKITQNQYHIVDEKNLLSFRHRIHPLIKAGIRYAHHFIRSF